MNHNFLPLANLVGRIIIFLSLSSNDSNQSQSFFHNALLLNEEVGDKYVHFAMRDCLRILGIEGACPGRNL